MPNYLVTYDLRETRPDPHSEFIEQAEARGWAAFKWGPQSKKWLRLPNTTLIGEFADLDAAKAAFGAVKPATEVALGASITVEKFILVAYGAYSLNSDDKRDAE